MEREKIVLGAVVLACAALVAAGAAQPRRLTLDEDAAILSNALYAPPAAPAQILPPQPHGPLEPPPPKISAYAPDAGREARLALWDKIQADSAAWDRRFDAESHLRDVARQEALSAIDEQRALDAEARDEAHMFDRPWAR